MPLRRLSPGRRRRFLLLTGIVVVIGAALAYLTVALERKREVDELRAMSDSVAHLRAAADSCRTELARQETAFRRFDARVDSLRRHVADYESLDPEGVPSDDYEAYLDVFDRYNASVEEWEARADSLRGREAACRTVARRHNLLVDSLRRRVRELDPASGT